MKYKSKKLYIENLPIDKLAQRYGTPLYCYSLNKNAKERVIRNFITIQNIKVTKGVFWYLLDNFSNEYVLLIKQLELLSLFDAEINTINDIENAVFVENKIEINKMFFHIFKNNNTIINIFNKNIYCILNNFIIYIKIIFSFK